jgi:hypothetical protein
MTLRRTGWALAAALLCASAAAAADVELYKARFRPAAELAEVVSPLLAPDGVAVADDSGGFVLLRGSPEAVAQALDLLATLDVAPRQFRISSELVSHSVLQARGIRVDGWIQVGELRIGRGHPHGAEGLEVSGHQLRADSGRRFQATVVALENTPAEIWTGNVFPFSTTHVQPGSRRGRRAGAYHETTAWMPVRQGLRVRARSSGDAIELDLVPVLEEGSPASGIREMGASTRVRVAPGEQVVIGSLGRDDSLRTGDPLARATEEDLAEDLLLVRVEQLD